MSLTDVVKDNLPELLTGAGIAGIVGTAVLAVKATPRAMQKIEEEKKKLNKDKLTIFETVKATWTCFIPAAIAGVGSAICVVGVNSVYAQRNGALAAALSVTEGAFKDYREANKEVIGEEKELEVQETAIKNKEPESVYVSNDHPEEYYYDSDDDGEDDGIVLCYVDNVFGREILCTRHKMREVEKALNRRLLGGEGYISMNDFYSEFFLDDVTAGDVIGIDGYKGMFFDLKEGRDIKRKGGKIVVPLIFRQHPVHIPIA